MIENRPIIRKVWFERTEWGALKTKNISTKMKTMYFSLEGKKAIAMSQLNS